MILYAHDNYIYTCMYVIIIYNIFYINHITLKHLITVCIYIYKYRIYIKVHFKCRLHNPNLGFFFQGLGRPRKPQVHPFEEMRGAESGAEHAEIAGWDPGMRAV